MTPMECMECMMVLKCSTRIWRATEPTRERQQGLTAHGNRGARPGCTMPNEVVPLPAANSHKVRADEPGNGGFILEHDVPCQKCQRSPLCATHSGSSRAGLATGAVGILFAGAQGGVDG